MMRRCCFDGIGESSVYRGSNRMRFSFAARVSETINDEEKKADRYDDDVDR